MGITVRRSLVIGRVFLLVSLGYSVVFGVSLASAGADAFASALPLILPIFAVIGGMGGMLVFSNDRVKGVLEYLLAYGVPPRRLFLDYVVASLLLATVVMSTAIAVALGGFVARGNSISAELGELLGLYSIPMTYASVAFASTVGMYWTSLSSPRAGMNSPVGLMPIVGIAPSVLMIAVIAVAALNGVTGTAILLVLVAAPCVIGTVVLLLLNLIRRLMPLERLLSPM